MFSSYESDIEPMRDEFQFYYYMFALVFLVFHLEMVFLYSRAMSFGLLGVSLFILWKLSFFFC